MSQKGIIALTLPLVVLLLVAALFSLIYFGIVKNPLKLIKPSSKEAAVSLQTQYQNPFDKSSQYVNPFSSYKNPFDNLK